MRNGNMKKAKDHTVLSQLPKRTDKVVRMGKSSS